MMLSVLDSGLVGVLIFHEVLRLFVEIDPVDALTHLVDVRGECRL